MVKNYYQKHKERLKEASQRCQNFTEEEKGKKHQYYQQRKQKLPEYRRNYYLTHKK